MLIKDTHRMLRKLSVLVTALFISVSCIPAQNNQSSEVSSFATPTAQYVLTTTEELEENIPVELSLTAIPSKTITVVPTIENKPTHTPEILSTPTKIIDLDSIEWKLAIPIGTDSCKHRVVDSFGNSFEIESKSELYGSTFCHAIWNNAGDQLAITKGDQIEVVNVLSGQRSLFDNPFNEQLNEGEYSYIDVVSWSKDSQWLEAIVFNRFADKPVEIYQSVLINTLTGDSSVFEENFRFSDWSPLTNYEFSYIDYHGTNYELGVFEIGIWNIEMAQPAKSIEEISEGYNLSTSSPIISPDGKFAVLKARDTETVKDVILLVDFEQESWKVLFDDPNGLIPWSWSPNGEWITFYESDQIFVGTGIMSKSPSLTPLNMNGTFLIRGFTSRNLVTFKKGNSIYVLDPYDMESSIILIEDMKFGTNIDPFSQVAFWATLNE